MDGLTDRQSDFNMPPEVPSGGIKRMKEYLKKKSVRLLNINKLTKFQVPNTYTFLDLADKFQRVITQKSNRFS